jgi:hypothetical protein
MELPVELAQVRYFVMLCKERNFSRAARRCGVSQPSLSNGIKALERELGGKLFDRSDMCLTPLGVSLRPQFEIVVARIRWITRRAADFRQREASCRRVETAPRQRDTTAPLNGTQSFGLAPQDEAAMAQTLIAPPSPPQEASSQSANAISNFKRL